MTSDRAQFGLAAFLVAVGAALYAAGESETRIPTQADPPVVSAPTYTLVAQFEGDPSCVRGWALVEAEPVWRVRYIPQLGWAFVDATEDQLRAAFTDATGRVAEAQLQVAMEQTEPLTRVTCRFSPLVVDHREARR